jgi:hypothetical protein
LPKTDSRKASLTSNTTQKTNNLTEPVHWTYIQYPQKRPFFLWGTFNWFPLTMRTGHGNFAYGELLFKGRGGLREAKALGAVVEQPY